MITNFLITVSFLWSTGLLVEAVAGKLWLRSEKALVNGDVQIRTDGIQ